MARGWLRVYLGAAPGVGKTYSMLNEGWRRHERGTDVVVGLLETHNRAHTVEQLRDLEVVPRRTIGYRGQLLEEMDLGEVLRRAPEVVLVDELAHTNVPGVEHEKRWQDIEDLLEAGINVITTVNLQHLESVNDVVETITGTPQRETVPDRVVRAAEQVELVDMTPEALRRRLAHGNVYAADRIDAALSHFFRPGNLAALRELALLWLADRVDDELQSYRERHGIEPAWETKERVVVAVTGAHGSERLIRRAARIAVRAKGELVGVTVRLDDGLRNDVDAGIERDVALIDELGGRYLEVVGSDVATSLVAIARAENATQLVIGATHRTWLHDVFRGSVVNRCIRAARGEIDVHVIGVEAGDADEPHLRPPRRRLSGLARRRLLGAITLGCVAFPSVTELLLLSTTRSPLALALSSYLLVVIAVAALGGLFPGLAAAAAAFLLSNFEFAPPIHTFTIGNTRDVLALVSFFVAAITVSTLVDFAARRSADAVRAQRNARALVRIATHVGQGSRGLDEMLAEIARIFRLRGVALRTSATDADGEDVVIGDVGPDATELPLDGHHWLIVDGPPRDLESGELLRGIVAQLVVALDRQRFEREAEEHDELKRADALRDALFAAVGHDLRTPLAVIRDAAESLRESGGTRNVLCETIETEVDRLEELVSGLLDTSRVSAGAVNLAETNCDLVDLVDTAIQRATGETDSAISVPRRTGVRSAPISADPTLVTEIITNLIQNALVHSGDEPVTVDIGEIGDETCLRVIDHGEGVPIDGRAEMFRSVDRVAEGGMIGSGAAPRAPRSTKGLVIARGFCDALGGQLEVEDTPGGGCTIVLTLPRHLEQLPIA